MAPEIPLDRQRRAEFVFQRNVSRSFQRCARPRPEKRPGTRRQRRNAAKAIALSRAAAIRPGV